MKNSRTRRELNEKKHFDQCALQYDVNYGYNDRFTKDKISRKSTDLVQDIKNKFKNKSLRILEVGCGTGEYTKNIANSLSKSKIVAIDISPQILKVAKEKCKKLKNISFTSRSGYSTGYKNNSFDVIFGFYVLHHMDIKKFSIEAKRILKDGGFMCFYEPNIINPFVFMIKSNNFLKTKVGDSPDEWAINPFTISKSFSNFKGIKISTNEFIWPIMALPVKLMNSISRMFNIFRYVPVLKYFGGSVKIAIDG